MRRFILSTTFLFLSSAYLMADVERNDLLLRGDICAQQGDIDQSIFFYTQAITEDPNNVKAYLKRADAYVLQRKLQQANDDFTQALRINPKEVKEYLESKKSGLLQYNESLWLEE